jgi:hypothetical protein
MPRPNTCASCKHWTPPDAKCGASLRFAGDCSVLKDWAGGDSVEDGAVAWDYEDYSCGVYVGPNFGCNQWKDSNAKT